MPNTRIQCECGFESGDRSLRIYIDNVAYDIPHSQIKQVHHSKQGEGRVIGITIPTWLAKDRGIA